MKVINNLLCKIFGHKWRPKLKDMYCIRCGVSRPKTFSESLGYDSLFAKNLSREIKTEFIGNTVYIKEFGDLSKREDK